MKHFLLLCLLLAAVFAQQEDSEISNSQDDILNGELEQEIIKNEENTPPSELSEPDDQLKPTETPQILQDDPEKVLDDEHDHNKPKHREDNSSNQEFEHDHQDRRENSSRGRSSSGPHTDSNHRRPETIEDSEEQLGREQDGNQRHRDKHGHNKDQRKDDNQRCHHHFHHIYTLIFPILGIIFLGVIGCCACCHCHKRRLRRKLLKLRNSQQQIPGQQMSQMGGNGHFIVQNAAPNPQVQRSNQDNQPILFQAPGPDGRMRTIIGYPLTQQVQPTQAPPATQCKGTYHPMSTNDQNLMASTDRSINMTTEMDYPLLTQQQPVVTSHNLYPSLQINSRQQQ